MSRRFKGKVILDTLAFNLIFANPYFAHLLHKILRPEETCKFSRQKI